MSKDIMITLENPFFGIFLSLLVYAIGVFLFKKTNGFFLFQPLFLGMVLGILVLWLISKIINQNIGWVYTNLYKPGGDIIFWFLYPATIAFAIPLYKRNDIVKKYWFEIIASLLIGTLISLFIIYFIGKLINLNDTGIASMLPQAVTTAVAMPIAEGIKGVPAITAMACIINAVIIYALGDKLIKLFRLKNPVGLGLGLGTAGHTIGSAKAVSIGSIEGSMASIAVVIISIVVDLVVPLFAKIMHLA